VNRYVNTPGFLRRVFREDVRLRIANMTYFDLKWSMRNMDEAIRGQL
jgi:hypothetical protein